MKKSLICIAIMTAGLFVASCGNKNAAPAGEGGEATEQTSQAVELDEDSIGPGVLNVNQFAVDVPEGWKVIDKKAAGYIRMRPADNGFASFTINHEEGNYAEASKDMTKKEEKNVGDNKFSFFEDKEDVVAYLNIGDKAYLCVRYDEIDAATAEKVLASIKVK